MSHTHTLTHTVLPKCKSLPSPEMRQLEVTEESQSCLSPRSSPDASRQEVIISEPTETSALCSLLKSSGEDEVTSQQLTGSGEEIKLYAIDSISC